MRRRRHLDPAAAVGFDHHETGSGSSSAGRSFASPGPVPAAFSSALTVSAPEQLIKVIAWSGAIYAAYGILAHLFDPTRLLWREKEAYLASVTGTFVNRNTAGAYLVPCAVLWSLLFWERVRLEMPVGPIEWRKMPGLVFSGPRREPSSSRSPCCFCVWRRCS